MIKVGHRILNKAKHNDPSRSSSSALIKKLQYQLSHDFSHRVTVCRLFDLMSEGALHLCSVAATLLLLCVMTALTFTASGGALHASLPTFALLSVLIWISHSDLRRREIPDTASLLVAGVGAALWVFDPFTLFWNVIAAGTVTLILGMGGRVLWRRTGRECLGLGDAKLIGAGTMLVGWDAVWLMLLLASVGGIVAVCVGRARQADGGVPFGPFLAYGILATHLIAGPV